jgi:FixJ family two-component response regulator
MMSVSEQVRSLRIAIVDDEPAVRVGLRRLCCALGVEATAYESGHLFLAALHGGTTPDCVLLDMHMPEMSGLEVQRRMAELTDRVAVLAITADDSPETSVRWLARGALACLRKPIGVDELIALFTSVIEWQTRSRVA